MQSTSSTNRSLRTFVFVAACIIVAGSVLLVPSRASAGPGFCSPWQNCFRDDDCDQGYCSNRVCKCDSPPPRCTDTCADRGLENNRPPGGATVDILDCYGINGALSYCFERLTPSCVGNEGSACSPGSNSCGMPGSGTVQCDGSCSGTIPPNSACGVAPIGWQDVTDCTSAWGWTFDGDYAGPTTVHIYANTPPGASTFMGAVTANGSRPDVGAVFPGRTNSGWNFPIPASLKDGLAHNVYAYAINVNSAGAQSGTNPLLSGSPKSITCASPPTGTFSAATCGATGPGSATGSASDPQGSPVNIAIYDGPSGGGGTQIGTGQTAPGGSFTIPFTRFTNGQVHTLYAYGQDIPTNTWYQLTNTQPASCTPTVTLNAAPTTVGFASSATLNWSNITNATSCTGSPGGWFNPGTVVNGVGAGSASSGPLTSDTTFTLTCTNAAGQPAAASTTVTVVAPTPVATIVNVSDTNYCTVGPGVVVDWKYESVARPIGFYQVQVYQGSTKVYDSTKLQTAAAPLPPLVEDQPGLSPWTLLRATIIDMLRWLFGEDAQACHGNCASPYQNGCAQACDEGGMGGLGYCVDSAPGDGYVTNNGWGKRNGNGNCGGWGNCIVRNCPRDFQCNGGFTKVGGGGNDSNGPDGWCRPSCSPNQGNSCQSGANICGMRNSGTIQCGGGCSASTPPNSACPAPTCSANPTQAAVGATVTVTGASGVGAYTWDSGGGTPATGPGTPSRTFTYPTTGAKTITISDGNKSATCAVTVCVANVNQPCASAPNACGVTGAGTIQCNGTCNAVTPPLSSCPPPSCSVNPASVNAGQPVTATGSSGIPPYTWTSTGIPATGPPYTVVFPAAGTQTITVRDSIAHSGTCNVNVGASYTTTGTYTAPLPNMFSANLIIKLVVWDNGGQKSATASFPYITKDGPWPTASFSYSPNPPFAQLPVKFTDKSKNATAWDWDFGDGQTDPLTQSPSHTYATQGNYSVTLKATNTNGTCSITKSLKANKPLPKFREVRPGSQPSQTPEPRPTPTKTPTPGPGQQPPPNDGR